MFGCIVRHPIVSRLVVLACIAVSMAYSRKLAAQVGSFTCTAENTLDYRQVIRSSKNLMATTLACFAGEATADLHNAQRMLAKSKTCTTNDSLAFCAQSMTALANSAQFTAPFEAVAKELSEKTGKPVTAGQVITSIVRNFDKRDQGTGELTLPAGGYDVTFSARQVLYAQLVHSLRNNDVSLADQSIPREAKDCFEASAGATARACRDLGKIIAGRALKGLETTSELVEQ